jgi:hypothetical protein
MIKHTKTKEFLDTSLSKLKLHKLFAIDIAIQFKPFLDSKPRKLQNAEAQTQTDNILKGNYGDITLAREKNKYSTLSDDASRRALSRGSIDTNALLDNAGSAALIALQERNTALNASISTALAQTQNAELSDIIKTFLEENARFWSFVRESIDTISRTSEELKSKIEKGS